MSKIRVHCADRSARGAGPPAGATPLPRPLSIPASAGSRWRVSWADTLPKMMTEPCQGFLLSPAWLRGPRQRTLRKRGLFGQVCFVGRYRLLPLTTATLDVTVQVGHGSCCDL